MCDSRFIFNDAIVVCRQLGYSINSDWTNSTLKGAEGLSGCNRLHALDMKPVFFSAEETVLELSPLTVVPTIGMLESFAQVRFLYMHY